MRPKRRPAPDRDECLTVAAVAFRLHCHHAVRRRHAGSALETKDRQIALEVLGPDRLAKLDRLIAGSLTHDEDLALDQELLGRSTSFSWDELAPRLYMLFGDWPSRAASAADTR